MKTPKGKKHPRNFSDIRSSIHSGRSGFGRRIRHYFGGHTVNLRPTFYRRHRWLVSGAAVVVAIVSIFLVRQILTRAEVADFYPSICLGTWQNPANAQGHPETLGVSSSSFTGANSAIFAPSSGGAKNQIFCGGFLPSDFQPQGTLTNVGLTLVWQVSTTTPAESSSNALAPAASSTSSSTTPDAPTSTKQSPPQPTSTPAALPHKESSSSTTSFFYKIFSRFFMFAFAEGTSSTANASSTASIIQSLSPTSTSTSTSSFSTPAPTAPNASSSPVISASSSSSVVISATSTAISASSSSTVSTTEQASPISTLLTGNNQTSTKKLSSTSSTASSTTTLTPTVVPLPPDQSFLKISYSTDGQNWIELQKVDLKNWPGLTIGIPLANWDDLKKLQIQVEEIPAAVNPLTKIYLDGMILEVHYDLPPLWAEITTSTSPVAAQPSSSSSEQPVIVLPPDKKPVPLNNTNGFKADEAPSFDLDLNSLPLPTSTATSSIIIPSFPSSPNGTSSGKQSYNSSHSRKPEFSLLSFFLKFFEFERNAYAGAAPANWQNFPDAGNPIVSKILDPSGGETSFSPTFITVGSRLRITLPEPGRNFIPGRYTLELWLFRNGIIYFTSSSFNWGVLAVNFNKSVYALGDAAKMGFAVLDDQGHTICDADIETTVVSPSGKTKFLSTANQKISRNPTCGPHTVTNEPDYSAEVAASEEGIYRASVVAKTRAGLRQITDSFVVQNQSAFDVERLGPTRIYPPADYTFTIHVKANQNFSGRITETIPASFNVSTEIVSQKISSGDSQEITWNVGLNKGDSIDLVYSFRAPNISPELYKLGPLQIGSWQEARQWQIAADANTVIFITSTASTTWTVPSDWNNASNTIECIGAGGNGAQNASARTPGGGGGGGSYAKITNQSLSAGSVTIQIASSGSASDTFFKSSTGTTVLDCGAGGNASGISAGSAGSVVTGTGFSGGAGGAASNIARFSGGGGGGAAGPSGIGQTGGAGDTTRGNGGGGGGGSDGGSSTAGSQSVTATIGGNGGNGTGGTGSGTGVSNANGNPGTAGTGGGGGGGAAVTTAGSTAFSGGAGAIDNSWDSSHGAGAGGGGGAENSNSTNNTSSNGGAGASGGTYGGGGGGGGGAGGGSTTHGTNGTGGSGGQGIIVITYTPSGAVTISCAASTSTTSFGTIDTTAVTTSTPNASTSMSCSGALGCTLFVQDAGSTAQAGLFRSVSPTYLIPSPNAAFNATATLAAGTDGYGIQATTTAAGTGGTLTVNTRYLQSGNIVGGLSTTTLALASSTVAVTGREVLITHFAAVGANTLGGSYADTITYSCLSN